MEEGDRAFRRALLEGAGELNIELTPAHLEAFELYLRELLRWNRRVNLTSLQSEEEIAVKHFLDSLTISPFVVEGEEVLDLGSGAGFPGLVLKIYRPSLLMVLLDATLKRVFFLRHLIRVLGLEKVKALHGRAEDSRLLEGLGGRFDLVVSRAFGPLRTLLPLVLPYLKPGGRALAMKGPRGEEELRGLERLPMELLEVRYVELPWRMGSRTLLLFGRP